MAHGVPPTIRELAALCHLSTTTMRYRLDLLAAHGYIERTLAEMRGIRVMPPAEHDSA